jgi:biopolymer transport protein TolR
VSKFVEDTEMAFSMGRRGGLACEMNVTPMIDLLLVLIIIFMVVLPDRSVGLQTELPQPAPPDSLQIANPRDIVVRVAKDQSIRINEESVAPERLEQRLREIFARRATKLIFILGDRNLEFRDVARVIDRARGAGVMQVALMTE